MVCIAAGPGGQSRIRGKCWRCPRSVGRSSPGRLWLSRRMIVIVRQSQNACRQMHCEASNASIGTAKLMFWPTLSDPTTIPSIRASASTSTPPLDPGANGRGELQNPVTTPAPGTSSAIRVALRMPEDAVQGKPTAFDTTKHHRARCCISVVAEGQDRSPASGDAQCRNVAALIRRDQLDLSLDFRRF